MSELNRQVVEKSKIINEELLKKYFGFQDLISMQKELYKSKNAGKNNKLANMIKSGLKDLKKDIEQMGDDVNEIEKPDEIVDIVEKILEYNRQNQEGLGLKILTPHQMFSRLPITLAQIKSGNNLEKLKNEIRQLLYSLHRSRNLTKTLYNNLINTF